LKKKITIPPKKVHWNSLFCLGWHTNALCCSLLSGIPTVCLDEESLGYDISSHSITEDLIYPDREEWFNKLSWANWSVSEVGKGKFWPLIEENI